MKFQIGINANHDKNYILLDPNPKPGNIAYTKGLDILPCEDGECVEILAPDMLNYISINDLPSVLKSWMKKLRYNGVVKLGGIDLLELVRLTNDQYISSVEFNEILSGKNCIHSCSDFLDLLSSIGLTVKKRHFNGIEFIVEFVK